MNLSTLAVNGALDAIAALCNGGFVDIYGHKDADASSLGAQPANSDTAITTQTKLASNQFAATAFTGASALQTVAAAIAQAQILVTGYARFARFTKADHVTVVADMSIGMANPVVNGSAARNATSVPVAGLSAAVFNGDRFLVGGNKIMTVAADAAINATALVTSALADALASGDTAVYDMLWDNQHLQAGATCSVSSFILSISRGY